MKKIKVNKLFIAAIVVVALIVVGTVAVSAATAFVESQSIGVGNAVELALNNAGVNETDAEITKAKLSLKDGRFVYLVNFSTGNETYKYELDSKSGEVISVTVLPSGSDGSNVGSGITLDDAKKIAAKTAGISEENCVFTSVKLENDDGKKVYDVDFYTVNGNFRNYYEFEISATDGTVAEYKTEENLIAIPDAAIGVSPVITSDDAKIAALESVGVTSDNVTALKTELDYERGVAIFKVEFDVTGDGFVTEYEIEVLAFDGSIIKRETEYKNTGAVNYPGNNDQGASEGGTNTGEAITIAQAKEIAFADAGLDETQVRLKKAQYERDDGRYVFEIEFTFNGAEYEYKIDSRTGKIIDKEVDYD